MHYTTNLHKGSKSFWYHSTVFAAEQNKNAIFANGPASLMQR